MIVYTYYSTDSRIKHEVKALIDVDFIVLQRPDEPKTELINSVKIQR